MEASYFTISVHNKSLPNLLAKEGKANLPNLRVFNGHSESHNRHRSQLTALLINKVLQELFVGTV